MVAPNNDIWAWATGFTPEMQGEHLREADTTTYIAHDKVKAWDAVTISDSGSAWSFPTTLPKVSACGTDATISFHVCGVALNAANSGDLVTVKQNGIAVCKTNKAITGGDWVTPAKFGVGEKYGCVYKCANTGDPIIGQALNSTEAPATAGTGSADVPFQYRPVFVRLFIHGDPLNR